MAVITLVISLNVSFTVRRLVLVLAAEALFVAAVALPIAVMFRGARTVACLPVLQTVVGAILKAVLGGHVAVGFGARSILTILSGGITVGFPIVLIPLIVSSLIGATVARIIGLQPILVRLIIGAISLAMAEALLVHEVVRVISAVRVVAGLVLL